MISGFPESSERIVQASEIDESRNSACTSDCIRVFDWGITFQATKVDNFFQKNNPVVRIGHRQMEGNPRMCVDNVSARILVGAGDSIKEMIVLKEKVYGGRVDRFTKGNVPV